MSESDLRAGLERLIEQWQRESVSHEQYLPDVYHKAAIEYKRRCKEDLAALLKAVPAQEPEYKVIKVTTDPPRWIVRGQDTNGNWVREAATVFDAHLAEHIGQAVPPAAQPEYEELVSAVLRYSTSPRETWTHRGIVNLADAHAQDSQTMDEIEAAQEAPVTPHKETT